MLIQSTVNPIESCQYHAEHDRSISKKLIQHVSGMLHAFGLNLGFVTRQDKIKVRSTLHLDLA